jgi:hypothetical protein
VVRGVVFLLFESYVVEHRGHDAYEDLLDAVAGRIEDDPFLGPKTYRDDDLIALVDAEVAASGTTRPTLLREFGRFSFPRLVTRYAWATAGHRDFASFVAYMKRAAHGIRGFEMESAWPHVRVRYRAPNALCPIAEGLLVGSAEHFGVTVAIEKLACVDRGDATCTWDAVIE